MGAALSDALIDNQPGDQQGQTSSTAGSSEPSNGVRGASASSTIDEQKAREDFARFWEQYVPGGSRTTTVSRPLMREVLLRAVRELSLSPRRASWAEELVASALMTAPPALASEDAFGIFRSVMTSLRASCHLQGSDVLLEALRRDFNTQYPVPPTSNGTTMPKGARTVDSAPARKLGSLAFTRRDLSSGELALRGDPAVFLSAPMRPTRAALESIHARLRASFGAAQGNYERLVLKAEALRDALARGQFDGLAVRDAKTGSDQSLTSGFSSSRIQAEIDRLLERLRSNASVFEKQQRELMALKEECSLQTQRAQAAFRRRDEAREKLDLGQQESSELSRQAKTEQLRALMLREAFEQEQARVGVSLGRAEAYVSDLIAATEGTRRIEVEEQAVARECITALNEIHSAQAREELQAEAKLAQLMRELQAAKDTLVTSEQTSKRPEAASESQLLQAKVQDATAQLAELRRRSFGAASIIRRRAADAAIVQREIQALKTRSEMLSRELKATQTRDGLRGATLASGSSALGNLISRLHIEEAAEAALQVAEARLEGELVEAQLGSVSTCGEPIEMQRRDRASEELAQRCIERFSAELQEVRSELSAASMPKAIRSPAPNNLGSDLAAAGLQRRVGIALAAEFETKVRLEEERLQHELIAEDLRLLQNRIARSNDDDPSAAASQLTATCVEVSTGRATPIAPAVTATESVAAAVAAADVSQAPAVAAAELQARLAALRGDFKGQNRRVTSPVEESRRIAVERKSSLQIQLEALRQQLSGQA